MRISFDQLKDIITESGDTMLLDLVIDEVIEEKKDVKNFFIPVTVSRGRKFKGNGYITGARMVDNGGFSGSGIRPRKYYYITYVWDPVANKSDSFNGEFGDEGVDKWNVSEEQRCDDMAGYLFDVLKQCAKSCGRDEKHRMFWLRKVLSLSTATAEELARASMEFDDPS